MRRSRGHICGGGYASARRMAHSRCWCSCTLCALPASNFGRFANTMSCFVKHSSATDPDDTAITRRDPNRSDITGPYFLERLWRDRNSGGFRRCKWPKIGTLGGLGGSFLLLFSCAFDSNNFFLKTNKNNRKNDVYITMPSLLVASASMVEASRQLRCV